MAGRLWTCPQPPTPPPTAPAAAPAPGARSQGLLPGQAPACLPAPPLRAGGRAGEGRAASPSSAVLSLGERLRALTLNSC